MEKPEVGLQCHSFPRKEGVSPVSMAGFELEERGQEARGRQALAAVRHKFSLLETLEEM